MRKITKLMLTLALLVVGVGGANAQDETDITTLPWVTKGQSCTQDFNNENGGTVYGTDAGGTNISYVDLSAYGTIKLYGTASQRARLFINREESGDNGTFYVDINSEGVGTFDCNTVLTKQPLAQYIHLNGVKAESWNTHLNLSRITVSGSAITFPEAFNLPDGEVEINSLPWVNQGQGCTNNLGSNTDAPIYGTDAGPSDGNLSYVDATDYSAVKLYGPDGTVRLFINRAEYASGTFQFYVTIEDGVGTLNLADVYAAQSGATYIHINGVKASSPGAKAQVNHITLVEKPFEFPEGVTDLTTLPYVNEGQDCVNNLGTSTDATIYGTDAGPSDGNLSYIDVTDYSAVKLFGAAGDVVRLFINRAEYSSGTFQFFVTIGEDGVGTLNLADVYAAQSGATYVHINGFKASQTWASIPDADGKALVKHIGVAIDVYTVAGTENLTGFNWDVTENPMTLNKETGKYEKTFENVAIHANEDYKFKVVMNGSWDTAWPANDWVINTSVTGGEGNYDITITIDPNNDYAIEVICQKHLFPFSATLTTNLGWEHVYAYAWTGENYKPLGVWDDKYEIFANASGVYELNFNAESAPANIIFHNGAGVQTSNLVFEDGKAYTWSKFSQTVTYTNPEAWTTVNAFIWTEGVKNFTGEWPGAAMTKDGDVYTYSVENIGEEMGDVPGSIIFNNGNNGDYNQTLDLAFEAGKEYTDGSYVTVNVGTAGYATYCSDRALDFSNVQNLTAYTAAMTGNSVSFNKVEASVPAENGLLIKGVKDQETSAKVPFVQGGELSAIQNALVGVLTDTHVDKGAFVLLNGTQGVGFYKTTNETGFTVRAHSAYLPAIAGARSFIALDEATAIEGVAAGKAGNGEIYNLQGQRVVKAQKGLYIIDGKKVMVK